MKYLIIIMALASIIHNQTIFNFNKKASIENWKVVDDGVMGGLSQGNFYLNEAGNGVFEGKVSLENNGGFSSVRYRFPQVNIEKYTKLVLNLKGDGKDYQIRIKDDSSNYYSYITYTSTTGEWQKIEIPLSNFYPSFRGRKLDAPNFSENSIEEFAILIANKKAENFKLLLDEITLK